MSAAWCDKHEVYDRCGQQVSVPRSIPPTSAARGGRFRRVVDKPAVLAEFDGTCSDCGEEIRAGIDMIVADTETRILGGQPTEVKHGWRHHPNC